MNLNLYSIYDRKMNVYLTPFPARGDVDAKRQVSASFADAGIKSTPAGQNPEDFDLVKLGTFDDETGVIARAEVPLVLANLEYLRNLSADKAAAQLPS